uniref:Uncharacterized protein n=1 Tax=Sphaerodactylus townsendi TaxID=933632 RepID=A0ACB8FM78_9SAUR
MQVCYGENQRPSKWRVLIDPVVTSEFMSPSRRVFNALLFIKIRHQCSICTKSVHNATRFKHRGRNFQQGKKYVHSQDRRYYYNNPINLAMRVFSTRNFKVFFTR